MITYHKLRFRTCENLWSEKRSPKVPTLKMTIFLSVDREEFGMAKRRVTPFSRISFLSFFFHFSFLFVLAFLSNSSPALVSEFNCFLRGRCSIEMWCLDDLGRKSWDWVGPPTGERA